MCLLLQCGARHVARVAVRVAVRVYEWRFVHGKVLAAWQRDERSGRIAEANAPHECKATREGRRGMVRAGGKTSTRVTGILLSHASSGPGGRQGGRTRPLYRFFMYTISSPRGPESQPQV